MSKNKTQTKTSVKDEKTEQKAKQTQRKQTSEMSEYEKHLKGINDNQFKHSNLQVKLTPKFYQMMRTMVNSRKTEVGGMIAGRRDGNTYICENIYIPKQAVSGGDVDYDTDGVDDKTMLAWENGEEFIGQVHSHADMGVMWSRTDEDTIEKLRAHMDVPVVSIVTNHAGNMLCRVDYKAETPFGYMFMYADNVNVSLHMDEYEQDCEAIKKAVEENAQAHTISNVNNIGGSYLSQPFQYGSSCCGYEYGYTQSSISLCEDMDDFQLMLETLERSGRLYRIIPLGDLQQLRAEMKLTHSTMSDADLLMEYLEDSDDWDLYMDLREAIDDMGEEINERSDLDEAYNQGR